MENLRISSSNVKKITSDKFSASLTDYQTNSEQNWHIHDEFIVLMMVRGNVREQVKCHDTLINAFDIGIKAPEVKHKDYFCPKGVRVIRLSLSPKFVTELKSQSLINEGWDWLKGSKAIRPFLRIGQSLLQQDSEIEDDVHDLLAALLPNRKTLNSHPPFWLKRAKNKLDENFSAGLRLNQLAFQTGVHPVYLAKKFQQFFGCSVGGYVRQLQLQKVHSLIIAGKYNLADIASEAGFFDQAHLTRIFGNEFGLTPAIFRKLLI